MEVKVEIPEYNPNSGIRYNWENGFQIEVKNENEVIVLSANRAGLLSLANHLLNLAEENVRIGSHMHFDEFNSLETGSVELIIEKIQG